VGIAKKKVSEVEKRGGKLPLSKVLRLRVRYMTDGGVIGSEEFVRQVYEDSNRLKAGRRQISVAMKHGEWGGLHALRDLRKDLIGSPDEEG